jgi:hypothetical protein
MSHVANVCQCSLKEKGDGMKKIVMYLFTLAALAIWAVTATAAHADFKAILSGGEVVPLVKTMANGEAAFHLGTDGKALAFRLTVSGIRDITAAHIHIGKKGENGPPVVFLFHGPEKKGVFNGTLADGTITAKDLFGPLSGMTIKDLMTKIDSGDAYVVVHTERNPGGELRGQIR